MRILPLLAQALAVTVSLGTAAMAQDHGRIAAGVSSLGATIESSFRVHENVAIRGLAAGVVELSPTISFDGTDYSTNVAPKGVGAMIDFYPSTQFGLRMSAGVLYANVTAKGTATATAANPITVGSTTLTGGEKFAASVEFTNNVAPIISVGYDQPLGKGPWVLSGEIGAMFNGGYSPDVSVTGGVATVAPAQVQAEIDRIKADLPDVQIYPYVSIMLGFRF